MYEHFLLDCHNKEKNLTFNIFNKLSQLTMEHHNIQSQSCCKAYTISTKYLFLDNRKMNYNIGLLNFAFRYITVSHCDLESLVRKNITTFIFFIFLRVCKVPKASDRLHWYNAGWVKTLLGIQNRKARWRNCFFFAPSYIYIFCLFFCKMGSLTALKDYSLL